MFNDEPYVNAVLAHSERRNGADFDSEWECAPRQLRKYVEKEIALAWWLLGRQSAHKEALEMQNEDMREIIRVAGEKVRGG